ncbi:MAG: hypothetical protein AAGH46_07465 [Bacteroidota bacterium]
MESINRSFSENRIVDAITVLAIALFLIFFIKSVVILIDAFQDEVYYNAVAQLSSI